MKLLNHDPCDGAFGMADLNPKKTKLPVVIRAEHNGVSRNVSHRNTPRVKIGIGSSWQSYSIESEPKLLRSSNHLKKSELSAIKKGVDYLKRNHDLFLLHFMDTDFEFDDDDLKDALRERGDYL